MGDMPVCWFIIGDMPEGWPIIGDMPVIWPIIGGILVICGIIPPEGCAPEDGGGGGGAGGRCMNDALGIMPGGIPVPCIGIGIPPVICACWYAPP